MQMLIQFIKRIFNPVNEKSVQSFLKLNRTEKERDCNLFKQLFFFPKIIGRPAFHRDGLTTEQR